MGRNQTTVVYPVLCTGSTALSKTVRFTEGETVDCRTPVEQGVLLDHKRQTSSEGGKPTWRHFFALLGGMERGQPLNRVVELPDETETGEADVGGTEAPGAAPPGSDTEPVDPAGEAGEVEEPEPVTGEETGSDAAGAEQPGGEQDTPVEEPVEEVSTAGAAEENPPTETGEKTETGEAGAVSATSVGTGRKKKGAG